MAARARRDPAAEGRELEALRVVPDGEPVRLQRRLDRGPADPALDASGAARRVDLEHAVEMAQIEADRAGVAVAHMRLDAADDRGAAAERNDGDLRLARPIEHGGDVDFALRQGHEVGRVGEVAREGAHRFRIGLAVRVQKPFVRLLRQDACERGGRRDARRAERDVGCSRRRREAGLDAETGGDKVEQMLTLSVGEARVLEAPAVEFQPLSHGSFPRQAATRGACRSCGRARPVTPRSRRDSITGRRTR